MIASFLEAPSMLRRPTLFVPLLFLVAPLAHAADTTESIERLRKDLTYLTSDECEGRGAQTKSLQKAADYIAAEFHRLGLKPGGLNNTYYQPYTMRSGRAKPSGTNSVTLKGPLGQEVQLKLGAGFQIVGLAGSGTVTAPVVFAGYGLSLPEPKIDKKLPI